MRDEALGHFRLLPGYEVLLLLDGVTATRVRRGEDEQTVLAHHSNPAVLNTAISLNEFDMLFAQFGKWLPQDDVPVGARRTLLDEAQNRPQADLDLIEEIIAVADILARKSSRGATPGPADRDAALDEVLRFVQENLPTARDSALSKWVCRMR